MKYINDVFGIEGIIMIGGPEWITRLNDLGDWLVESKHTGEFFAVIGEETAKELCRRLNEIHS